MPARMHRRSNAVRVSSTGSWPPIRSSHLIHEASFRRVSLGCTCFIFKILGHTHNTTGHHVRAKIMAWTLRFNRSLKIKARQEWITGDVGA